MKQNWLFTSYKGILFFKAEIILLLRICKIEKQLLDLGITTPSYSYMPLWDFSDSMFGVSDLRWGKIFSFQTSLPIATKKSENHIAWWQP